MIIPRTPSRMLKYSKHFNILLCNCSKTFGFLCNCTYQGSVEKAPQPFQHPIRERAEQIHFPGAETPKDIAALVDICLETNSLQNPVCILYA